MFQPLYEWYMGQLGDADQEVVRFLRKTGEDHLANMPTTPGRPTVSRDVVSPLDKFKHDFRDMGIHQRSKWERIGNPLFTPAFEMAMYFTPMNPIVYRGLRGIKLYLDSTEGVFD